MFEADTDIVYLRVNCLILILILLIKRKTKLLSSPCWDKKTTVYNDDCKHMFGILCTAISCYLTAIIIQYVVTNISVIT